MKGIRLLLLVFSVILFAVSGASAATIGLFDYAFNVNGTIYLNTTVVPGLNSAAFDTATGLGSITLTYSPGVAGSYYVASFFDHEIDEAVNTFFNEIGSANGVPAAGQSWEIDEPGFLFGDIYANFLAGTLDNTIGTASPEDVSMAMGWNFPLAADETATIVFRVGLTPPSGFYLQHTDPDSQDSPADIYFDSSLRIGGGGPTVPEPGTMLLLGSGVAGLIGFGRKKLFKK